METKTKRILVVGNENHIGELIVDILKKSGYSDVLLARNNGMGIVEIEGGYCPHLIIVTGLREDESGTRGEEVIKFIKSVSPQIKAIALSGAGDVQAAASEARAAGADDFLSKPFKPEVLMTAVNTLLGQA